VEEMVFVGVSFLNTQVKRKPLTSRESEHLAILYDTIKRFAPRDWFGNCKHRERATLLHKGSFGD